MHWWCVYDFLGFLSTNRSHFGFDRSSFHLDLPMLAIICRRQVRDHRLRLPIRPKSLRHDLGGIWYLFLLAETTNFHRWLILCGAFWWSTKEIHLRDQNAIDTHGYQLSIPQSCCLWTHRFVTHARACFHILPISPSLDPEKVFEEMQLHLFVSLKHRFVFCVMIVYSCLFWFLVWKILFVKITKCL